MLGNDNDRRLARDTGAGRVGVLGRVVQWIGMRSRGGLSLPGLGRLRTASGELGSCSAVVGENETELTQCCLQQQPGGSEEVRVRLSRCGSGRVAPQFKVARGMVPARAEPSVRHRQFSVHGVTGSCASYSPISEGVVVR